MAWRRGKSECLHPSLHSKASMHSFKASWGMDEMHFRHGPIKLPPHTHAGWSSWKMAAVAAAAAVVVVLVLVRAGGGSASP